VTRRQDQGDRQKKQNKMKIQEMLKDAQDERAILRQRYVELDKDHEQQIPAIVRRLQKPRRRIQVLKERLVVLEERKVSTSQEISDDFMDRQEQQPIQLKQVYFIPELKAKIFLESIIGTTSEYIGDDTIAIINRKGANGLKSVIIGEEIKYMSESSAKQLTHFVVVPNILMLLKQIIYPGSFTPQVIYGRFKN
jgi:hypothetical protein